MRPRAGFASLAGLVFKLIVAGSTAVQTVVPQTDAGRCHTSSVPCTNLLSESRGIRRSERAWTRVRIRDPHVALLVRLALDDASRLLAESRCQVLLEEFRDGDGRPLSERLALLGLGVQQYLDFVIFEEGHQYGQCGYALGYTQPGSRIVYLCVRGIEREWQNRRLLVAKLIHEVLHTLGLGENPPSSAEITERVLRHCGDVR